MRKIERKLKKMAKECEQNRLNPYFLDDLIAEQRVDRENQIFNQVNGPSQTQGICDWNEVSQRQGDWNEVSQENFACNRVTEKQGAKKKGANGVAPKFFRIIMSSVACILVVFVGVLIYSGIFQGAHQSDNLAPEMDDSSEQKDQYEMTSFSLSKILQAVQIPLVGENLSGCMGYVKDGQTGAVQFCVGQQWVMIQRLADCKVNPFDERLLSSSRVILGYTVWFDEVNAYFEWGMERVYLPKIGNQLDEQMLKIFLKVT